MKTREERREIWKRWYHKNKTHRTSYKRRRYADNEELRIKQSIRNKAWAKQNGEHIKEYGLKWRATNKERIRGVRKKYQQDHAVELAQYRKDWRRKNRKRLNVLNEKWRRLNPEKDREIKRKWAAKKVASDINFRLKLNLRGRIADAMRQRCLVKSQRTVALIGCSIEDFKIYIESLFNVGMSWENYGKGNGKWEIDHIIPCALFDLANPSHRKRCFHFSNMQPMWSKENNAKRAKLTDPQFRLL